MERSIVSVERCKPGAGIRKELLRELSIFAETYKESSDFAEVRQRIADVWIKKNGEIESELSVNDTESQNTKKELEEVRADLAEWENQKEPQPERSEAVIRNRKRLDALGIHIRNLQGYRIGR